MARWSNQSILKEINPEYSLEELMLIWSSITLATWCRVDSLNRPWFQERLRAKGEGGKREWDDWMASSTQWTWAWANSWRWWRTGTPGVLQSMQSQTRFSDWTATTTCWQLIASFWRNWIQWLFIHPLDKSWLSFCVRHWAGCQDTGEQGSNCLW